MTASLAYRKNEAAIQRGEVPDKYTRLLPFITGQKIIEIGSAEGVLALLLARDGKHVTALEKSDERHAGAANLFNEWSKWFSFPGEATFVRGDVLANLGLLEGRDTLVAVRSIYYLGTGLDTVFTAAAKHIQTVVLCGNKNRAARWRAGTPDEPLGEMNRYAAREGMVELLTRHGYRITQTVLEGDEIVVGER